MTTAPSIRPASLLIPIAFGAHVLMLGGRFVLVFVIVVEVLRARAVCPPPTTTATVTTTDPTPSPVATVVPDDPPPLPPRTTSLDLHQLTMTSANVGWALSRRDDTYDLARTEDGGETFSLLGPSALDCAAFIDSSTAVVAATNRSSQSVFVSRTSDAGKTWSSLTLAIPQRWSQAMDLEFDGPLHGAIALSEYDDEETSPLAVFETHDGGRTWSEVVGLSSLFVTPRGKALWALQATSGQLLRAVDGKTTTVPELATCKATDVPRFFGARGYVATICTTGTFVWRTFDGGATWTRMGDVGFQADDGAVLELSDADHVFLTSGHVLAKSADGGATWTTRQLDVESTASVVALRAVSANELFATVADGPRERFMRTSDAGETWHDLPMRSDGAADSLRWGDGASGLAYLHGPTGTEIFRPGPAGSFALMLRPTR